MTFSIPIPNLVKEQLIISKLKKEAKIFQRENPDYSLMESQNKIAKQYGYLHWHELHTLIKKRLELSFQSPYLTNSLKNPDSPIHNLYLGEDSLLKQKSYIHPEFKHLDISINNYSEDFIFSLFKNIMANNSMFIYCRTQLSETERLAKKMSDYTEQQGIKTYNISFTNVNNSNNVCLDISKLSPGVLTELFVTAIGLFEDEDMLMWKGRAISMMSCLSMALCHLRDLGEIVLSPSVIREYLNLSKFLTLYHRTDLPLHIQTSINSYLHSLPQFNRLSLEQPDIVMEQHGYLQMQYVKTLSVMIDTYPHIFTEDKIKTYSYVLNLDNPHVSLEKILYKKEKSFLIVDLPNFENSSYYCEEVSELFIFFVNYYLKNKPLTKKYMVEDFKHYMLLENMPFLNLDTRDKSRPIDLNYINLTKNPSHPLIIEPSFNNSINVRTNKD